MYRQLEMESKEYERLNREQGKIREGIQNYERKKAETELVKAEIEMVNEEEIVYKLIGPILIQQDSGDCKIQIDSRLEMIKKEISKLEKNYKENVIKMENKRKKVQDIQNTIVQMSKQIKEKAGGK
ncbi:MAG: prefoldin subunit [archaeon]|nr:prefoldin subunit [archaeon]